MNRFVVAIASLLFAAVATANPWSVQDNIRVGRLAEPAAYSADGRFVALVLEIPDPSADAIAARLEVYSVAALNRFAGGAVRPEPVFAMQVDSKSTLPGLGTARWSARGARLYFLARDGGRNRLMRWAQGMDAAVVAADLLAGITSYRVLEDDRVAMFTPLDETGVAAGAPQVAARSLLEIVGGWPQPENAFVLPHRKWILDPATGGALHAQGTVANLHDLMRDRAAGAPVHAIVVRQAYNTPPAVYALGKDGAARMLIDLAPHARSSALATFREIEWTDDAGRAWKGLLGVPGQADPTGRFPLLLQTHGFDENRFFAEGASTTAFPGRAALARGFVVLAIEESLPALFDDRKLEGPNAVAGYRAGIHAVATRVQIDRQRIGVVGWSRTSYHVKYALTHAPDLFGAAVCADGVDYGYFQYLAYYGMEGFDMGEEFASTYGGSPWTDWPEWRKEAPGFRLDQVRIPILIQANSMPNVIGEWEFYAGLRRLGKPVELLMFLEGAHSLLRPSERFISTQTTLDWMDFWLNDHIRTEPVPGSPETKTGLRAQYERWRALLR